MLTAVYYMLKNALPYRDLGPDYFDKRSSANSPAACRRHDSRTYSA
jgi:hypothetical protein